MNTNFNKKYKDRDPLDTIKLLDNYFEENGYKIDIEKIEQQDSSTWWCDIALYQEEDLLYWTHGKGTTKEYALASGYGEMYERFCNALATYTKPELVKFIQEQKYKKYGYYFNKEEKELSYKELISEPVHRKFISQCCNIYNNNLDNPVLQYYIGNTKCIGVPFKGINIKDTKYLNLPILLQITGSNGMAAGNSLEEAQLQAICEIIERDAIIRLQSAQTEIYKIIDNNNLNDKLKQIINTIETTGNKVTILDLSYNLGVPVVICIVGNYKNKNITSFWRCHPVFDLAVEGAITECYQRVGQINNDTFSVHKISLVEEFAHNHTQFNLQQHMRNNEHDNVFPEEIFLNAEITNDFNHTVFLDNTEYSNKYLLDYLIENILNKRNIKVYYYDSSLCKDLYAVQIFATGVSYLDDFIVNNFNQGHYNSLINIFNNNIKYKFIDSSNEIGQGNLLRANCIVNPLIHEWKTENAVQRINSMVLNSKKYSLVDIYKALYGLNDYSKNIIKYAHLFYCKSNGYSLDYTKKLYDYYNDDFTLEDWELCDNKEKFIDIVLRNNLNNYLSEENLSKKLKAYII